MSTTHLKNFGSNSGVTLSTPADVSVGETLDGITITGKVLDGPDHNARLKGGPANDYIFGSANANDVIVGGAGNDVLTGGATGSHHDAFVFRPGSGQDVITDFHGQDRINIAAYLQAGDHVQYADVNGGTLIDLGTGDTIMLLGVSSSQLVETGRGFTLTQTLVG